MPKTPLERIVRSNSSLAGRVRRDERCVILREFNGNAQVKFEDGETAIIPRFQLRAPKETASG
jgi:hypothetical protein